MLNKQKGNINKIRKANHVVVNNSLYEFVEGLLLGDGTLSTQRHNVSAYFENADKRLNYLEWLSNQLDRKGLKQSRQIYPMKSVKNGAFKYKTLTYFELGKIRKKWYAKKEKQIPLNFKITPVKLKYWYIGDGNFSDVPLIDSSIFSFDSLINVSLQLKKIGIEHTLREFKDRKRIRISKKSERLFFKYILSDDKHIPNGYEYKFPKEVVKNGS
ncbi:hypothetical protein LCGC14_1484410 [marine sediment metagenome]|uniref:Homing endonuclease LAGLIDADG domain-containing protein n=1 Tax=marine sediment metagenome TaxID=412755 RepID=A0A0F9A2Y5_9ZZZZ